LSTEVTVVLDERDALWLAGKLDAELGGITDQQLQLLAQSNVTANRSAQPDYQILNKRATRIARIANALFESAGHL
jgi:hypothetical protein